MNPDALEQQVLEDLQSLLMQYQSMNELAAMMLTADGSDSMYNTLSLELTSRRERIESAECASAPARQEYRANRAESSSAVRLATQQLGDVMQQLVMRLGQLEQQALARKQALLPHVQAGAQAVRMQNAYSQNS